MRIIQKEISLEPMTSRLPSVWPAYRENDHKLYLFDDESLSARSYEHTSNWGMVPVNVAITPKPSSEATGYSLVTDENCEDAFIMSFYTVSKWYHFFVEYYKLLNDYGHCNMIYSSATDYYEHESLTKYADQMIYGSDEQTYIDLDNEFNEKGGDTFFQWIRENIIPSFQIPSEYADYWGVDNLFYPDVIKWMAWFKDKNCEEIDEKNCCECKEYQDRGGSDILSAMTAWYNALQDNIIKEESVITKCFEPSIVLQTELQVSIDDLGEFSIFSEEYSLDKDYRTASYGDSVNTHSGTVATIDDKPMILSSGKSGHDFSERYMQKYVAKCNNCGYIGIFNGKCPKCGSENVSLSGGGWSDYTDKYISEHRDDFYVSSVTFYTFDENNVKYTASGNLESATTELAEKMTKTYPLTEGNWVLIDGVLNDIVKMEYGEYDKNNQYMSGNTFLVYREAGTDTPYTYINGKKIYADFYPPMNVFYFTFFLSEGASPTPYDNFNINNYKTFNRKKDDEDYVDSFNYNGITYVMPDSSDTVTIEGIEYHRTSGYADTEIGDRMYLIKNEGETEVQHYVDGILEKYENELYSATTEDKNILIKPIIDKFIIRSVDELTGRTVSKLADIRAYNVLTDDIGNSIEGIYVIRNQYTHQPPQGTELEPIYQVGNTANISRFSMTQEDAGSQGNNINYFVGDIITDMKFYYVNYEDKIEENTICNVSLSNSNDVKTIEYHYKNGDTWESASTTAASSAYTSLSAITYSTSAKTQLDESGMTCYDDIYCDITYCVGATLARTSGQSGYYIGETMNRGVTYRETVKFVKTNWEYYLRKDKHKGILSVIRSKRNDPCEHSISYPICVYLIEQNYEEVKHSQYETDYSLPMADFNFDINVFRRGGDTFRLKYPYDMEKHNGMEVFPVYREEYKLGIASMENVDSDIYIDRGINAAFEKHLKLGEVNSLEALIQYGNSYFKIMES